MAETAYVAQFSPFSIEIHGTRGSLIYSEKGIGEMVASRSSASQPPDAGAAPLGPDGRLIVRSALIDEAASRWAARELPPAAPPAFDQWVGHIQQGTRAAENIAIARDLTAIVEAAYRSAATGQLVRLDSLGRAE